MNILGLISQLIGIKTLRLTYIYIYMRMEKDRKHDQGRSQEFILGWARISSKFRWYEKISLNRKKKYT